MILFIITVIAITTFVVGCGMVHYGQDPDSGFWDGWEEFVQEIDPNPTGGIEAELVYVGRR